MQDDVERVAAHLQRALCTYVEGDDTRATELTGEELRDVARAIIPMVLEEAAKVAESKTQYRGRTIIAAAIRAIGAP